jgi:putative ABC transport system permease protein
MLRNFVKTAYRSLLINKGFTLINILGLALGLTACLLIIFYVFDELSYDRFNIKSNRIYRVNEDLKLGDNKVQYAVAMPPLAQALKNDFPEVENTVRIRRAGGFHIQKVNEQFQENNVFFADPSLFDVFTLPMLYGNAKQALTEPNSVVLTASAAKKYFSKLNVVGQKLIVDDNKALAITGVIKDLPKQSHFQADFLVSMATWADSRSVEWLRSDYNTYVLLREGADYKKLEAQFPQLLRKYAGGQMQSELNMSIDAFEKSGSFFRMNMMRLTDIHLHSNLTGELGTNGNVQYVYIFSAIALFILLIACVNFMNLSTARSSNRAREVGIRKVLGSSRGYLISQYLTESVLVTFVATLTAVVLAYMLLPGFNQLAGKNLELNAHIFHWLIPVLLVTILSIGFLAGSYPALFLSAFKPIDVLKGTLSTGFKGGRLRSILVVVQFSISIFLIIGTIVIYNQLNYIQTRDLGYNRNQVLVIQNAYELGNHAKTFKQEVKQLPGVLNATLTEFLPTSPSRNTSIFNKEAAPDPKKALFPQTWSIDEDYINTLDMKLALGRSFSATMPTDSSGIIINETAAKFLGFKDPLNKTLFRSSGGEHPSYKPYQIIGVIKDFNFSSFRENISPVVMVLDQDHGSLSVRVNTANIPALLKQIEQKWKLLSSTHFQYSFMDADFEASYRSEQRVGHIFIVFTSLAIIIACLGLFGLAAYAAEQRTREIGIRKVLGASVTTIVRMLSKDFIKLVIISIVIASPLAWLCMHKWLQDFAYRIQIAWWIPVLAGVTAIVIAFITVSFQSAKAAVANPVDSLRSE